ncbi:MAG: DUF563 domain-containing protein [Rhodobacteraceae bacterium]|nr:DUF563 domain-containing protein [Paracoccaceae bacterium]
MTILNSLRKLAGLEPSKRSGPPVGGADAAPTTRDLADDHRQWIALGNEGRFFEAIKLCLATVEKPEDHFLACSFLGYAYYQTTKYDLAIDYLEIALRMNPGDYYAAFFLAHALKAVGRKPESLKWFTACCRQHPDHAEEICDSAFPMAVAAGDSAESAEFFGVFESLAAEQRVSSSLVEKSLFFQGRDGELQDAIKAGTAGDGLSLRRISSVADWLAGVDSGESSLQSLGEAEVIRVVMPAANRQAANEETSVDASAPYVAELADASIVGGSSLIYVGRDVVLSDLLADRRYGRYVSLQYDTSVAAQRHDALLVRAIDAPQCLPEGVMLCGLASECYGHWFAEFLPRLRYLEQHPRFAEMPIIVDDGMPKSHHDFLRALVANPLHILPRGTALKVGKLVVAPTMTFFPVELFTDHAVPPERQASWTAGALRYIGERIRSRLGESARAADRIFLSRRNSTWRRLVNEEEILNDLQQLGFRAVFLEECSFAEQVRIFQGAEFVVAPNGSALNNLIFASPDVKALVIGQKNHFNWGGWLGPMMDLGYSPVFLSGEPIGDEANKHSDYTIPVAEVRRTIEQMLDKG